MMGGTTITTRKTYTGEFKRDAVQLAHATNNLSGTARDLGIGSSALRKWKNAAQEDGDQAFPGQGRQHLTADQQEIKRLRQENEILRQEREILDRVSPLPCQPLRIVGAAGCSGRRSPRT